MEGNMQEYLNNEVIGNVRTGTRGEKDNPIKLAYFDVHTDNSTSELAVEIFSQVYNKPTKLKIKFVDQHPMNIGLQRYEGKRLKCYGNNKQAKVLTDKGERKVIECNSQNCQYKKDKKCKFIGRLYFIIDKLENEGIWCYPMGSEKGIKNIWRRITRANRISEDLTKDWYELYLKPEDAIYGKNYIPDIKKVESVASKKQLGSSNHPKTQNSSNNSKKQNQSSNNDNYLMIKGFQMTMYENQKTPKIICINTNRERKELILAPDGKQDILNLQANSIILPISISKQDKGTILNDYKVVKAVSKETLNKKAV